MRSRIVNYDKTRDGTRTKAARARALQRRRARAYKRWQVDGRTR